MPPEVDKPPVTEWLPTDPPRPAPPVMTAEEAGLYLRISSKDARRTLKHYRDSGLLRGVHIGREIHYRIEDVRKFLDTQQKRSPR